MIRFQLFAFLLVFQSVAALAAESQSDWQLAWQDEFEGKTLDFSKWELEVNADGGGNNELQYYVTNNARVKDGLLFIEARKEHFTGPQGTREYTCARIRTRLKGDWRYDRFDIRAFHDQILSQGALPLDVLDTRIRAWVGDLKRGN